MAANTFRSRARGFLAALLPALFAAGSTGLVAYAPVWKVDVRQDLSWRGRSRTVPAGRVARGLPAGVEVKTSQGHRRWLGPEVRMSWPPHAEPVATGLIKAYPASKGLETGLWVRTAEGTPLRAGWLWWTVPGAERSGFARVHDGWVGWPAGPERRSVRIVADGLSDRLTIAQPAAAPSPPAPWPWSLAGWFVPPAMREAATGSVSALPEDELDLVASTLPPCKEGDAPRAHWNLGNKGPEVLHVTLGLRFGREGRPIEERVLAVPPYSRLGGSFLLPPLEAGVQPLEWWMLQGDQRRVTRQSVRVARLTRAHGRRWLVSTGQGEKIALHVKSGVLPGSTQLEILATAHAWGGFEPALGSLQRTSPVTQAERKQVLPALARLRRRVPWVGLPDPWPGSVPRAGSSWQEAAVLQAWNQLRPGVGPWIPWTGWPRKVGIAFSERALAAEVLALGGNPVPSWFVGMWPPPAGAAEEDLVHILRAALVMRHSRADQAGRHLWARRKLDRTGMYWAERVDVTAEALEALLDLGVQPEALEPGFRWLEAQRQGRGWETPGETAAVLAALAAWHEKRPSPPDPGPPPSIWLDGKPLGSGRPSKGARYWSLGPGRLGQVGHVLEIRSSSAWGRGSTHVVWRYRTSGLSATPLALPEGSLTHDGSARLQGDVVSGRLFWRVGVAKGRGVLRFSLWAGAGPLRVRFGQRALMVEQMPDGQREVVLPEVAAGRYEIRWEADAGPGGKLLMPPVAWWPEPSRPGRFARTEEQRLDLPSKEDRHVDLGDSL
ncbi:MAG: hypothetical protein VKO21_05395 [Candidatus Sericytochromatia bacterium]|nr:hypothetical protein [Candidatus Sericytochromatia bacterium]